MKDTFLGFIAIITLALLLSIFLYVIEQKPTDGQNEVEVEQVASPTNDMDIIRIAAERNGIEYGSEDWCILMAIRKAENGGEGMEFGIMNPEANTLDKQAGWCAASIVKSRARWVKAGKPEDFIIFMGRRYCPPDAHPLNVNWVGNVTYWKARLENKK